MDNWLDGLDVFEPRTPLELELGWLLFKAAWAQIGRQAMLNRGFQ